ncbi:hypothetical protein PRUB_a4235 [Pseudoalteromonas rubra]|uniref:SnoaL-like domain-containing protein n=1 Tax=Pseudoalteromonas rubra TaxID=43658 RepID=A0A8T0C4J6_9GAMM|nr:nuclear transport factor 2 family protein [Pseudoalteromonas rubra]KAF7785550.1 hypothetical protein PRUB_a4235 [Pseudoalteromonas rubra]
MNANARTMTVDEAKIRSQIHSFSVFADQGAFDYLGRVFAPQLTVDYSDLFGTEVQRIERRVLLQQWAGFLPGFDATLHELSNLVVTVTGDKAVARAEFIARHWLGETGFWSVSGDYEFGLIKAEHHWQISSIRLIRKAEQGSRDILATAPQHARQNWLEREARKVTG